MRKLLATVLASIVALTFAPPAVAAGPRPPFQLPFPCGERWLTQTRDGHKPNTNSLDMTLENGDSTGRPILASAAGEVVKSAYDDNGGFHVRIDHGNGWQTRYLHMIEQPAVAEGDQVTQGQRIGRVGTTGDSGTEHLHYEQMADGETVKAVLNGEEVQVEVGSSQVLTSHNCQGATVSNGVVAANVNGDAFADLLGRKPDGSLVVYLNSGAAGATNPYGSGRVIGSAWQSFSWFTAGPVNGDRRDDIIAVRASDGALVLYANNNTDTFPYDSGRVIGAGWSQFNRITAGDVTGDGRTDIVATKPDGSLLLYANNGTTTYPYDNGRAIGTGFQAMNRVLAADVTGDSRADLLTTDAAGSLFLYANSGNATSPYTSAPQSIGAGWSGFNRVATGEVTGDGRTDLLATRTDGTLLLYAHTGSTTYPYATGRVIGNGWQAFA